MRRIVEAVDRGALFLNTSTVPYLGRYGVYSRSTTPKGISTDFVRNWVQGLDKATREFAYGQDPVGLVQTLIKAHGLAILVKLPGNVGEASEARWTAKGVDGLLTQDDLVALARQGKITADTLIKPLSGGSWRKIALNFPSIFKTSGLVTTPKGLPSYRYYGVSSNLSAHQMAYIEAVFAVNGASTVYTFSDLRAEAHGQTTMNQLLQRRKKTVGAKKEPEDDFI